MRKYMILLVLLTSALTGFSKIELGTQFSDNMVLQQSAKIKIAGKTSTVGKVTVTTGWGKTYKATADKQGKFTVTIETPKAGGPYDIILDDGEQTVLKNILIGEVWLAVGQSNMVMPVKGFDAKQLVVNRQEMEQHASKRPPIRFLTLESPPSEEVSDLVLGKWVAADAQSVANFSAVAYEFARTLQEELKVPVGIIVAANSGTRIESWMSKGSLESIADKFLDLDRPFQKNSAAAMYNAMIAPLIGYQIKGFLWYQGEANRMSPGAYLKQFPAMLDDWRRAWGGKDLPFYTVEIAPFPYPTDKDNAYIVAFFRENQRKLASTLAQVGIISTVDVGSSTTVHPPDKTKVGTRLALLALGQTYGFKELYQESVYKGYSTDGDKISITFSGNNRLQLLGDTLQDMEIAGEDQVFHPANATLQGDRLLVWSAAVAHPKSVRYCFKAYSVGNLFTEHGLPVPPFRTDNWSIIQKKTP